MLTDTRRANPRVFIGGGGREAVSGRRRPAPEALGPAARGRSRAQSRSVPSARTPALPWCSGRPAPHSPLPGVLSEARGDGSGAVHGGGGVFLRSLSSSLPELDDRQSWGGSFHPPRGFPLLAAIFPRSQTPNAEHSFMWFHPCVPAGPEPFDGLEVTPGGGSSLRLPLGADASSAAGERALPPFPVAAFTSSAFRPT